MRIGYARVSTSDQNIELQLQALKAAGCQQIFTDHGASGASRTRSGLNSSLEMLGPGDTLVIWRLDRLGRSLSHLIDVVSDLGRRDIGLYSVTESIDTGSAGGILIFHIMGALAEFERALISERTRAGMSAARMRGSPIGRPPKLSRLEVDQARAAVQGGDSIKAAAHGLGVSRATLYRAMRGGLGEDQEPFLDAKLQQLLAKIAFLLQLQRLAPPSRIDSPADSRASQPGRRTDASCQRRIT
ncbi:recombinase family protein [Ciceribacter sp. L1K23]|uniref:recombinase family protein n=1 Tax=Ciceribacter sp. L1K23 TaxID=2820276 RepID=UPI001B83D2B5|nr:recombinase family protein [Ciceribacter sp. L1K23]MBR0556039.1 recombinase family protein [Ciceribacter sp. L1K23]